MKPAVLETSRNQYVVGDFLAEGGMGAIYLGKRIGSDGAEDEVILKALLPEYTSEPHFVDLFLREARLTAGLDHPNIVRTVDLVTGDGTYFIVMEYVRGADLRTLTRRAKRRGRQLSPQASIYAGVEILDALGYAHSRLAPDGSSLGLIHRDVSPSNLLASGDGVVKLSDFGIAKLSTHRSVFYKVKGKVGYMSPEQARGEPVDHRSDLFSLAVCIYEGLVGERLFAGLPMATPRELYARPPARPSQLRPELPVALDRIMARALAYAPDERFQSAAEMRDALSRTAAVHGLLYRRDEMAVHLREVLGADPRAWLRGELGEERGGGTEPYAPRGGSGDRNAGAGTQRLGLPDAPFGDEEDSVEDSQPAVSGAVVSGASLVSILEGNLLRSRMSAPPPEHDDMFAEVSTVHGEAGPRAVSGTAYVDEPTVDLEDGLASLLARKPSRPDPEAFRDEETVLVFDHARARRDIPTTPSLTLRLAAFDPSAVTPLPRPLPAPPPDAALMPPAQHDGRTAIQGRPALRPRDIVPAIEILPRQLLIVGLFTLTFGLLVGTLLGYLLGHVTR